MQKSIPLLILFLLFFSVVPLTSQTPFPGPGPVFRDDVIPRVDIIIPADSLATLFAPGNEESNYHWHATFLFDNGETKDTVEEIGFRLRGNTSRYAAKKSFKISFNTYEPGREWQGLEKMNLNGEHNDPTVVRSKLSWDLLREMGVPAPRANHIELYINGNYYGLYANVEHIDEEFTQLRFGNNDGNLYKCLWPADLVYKGDDPDLYKEEYSGRRAYELVTNETVDDYSDITQFIDILNNTPINDLPCELEKIFNIDNYLKVIAFDILSGNWDGPIFNKNNFYLYKNEANGKFEYIPYDLDNTFGIDWFNMNWSERNIYNWDPDDEDRPIYERILEVPEYRDQFSYYMDEFIQNIYREDALFPYLENIKAQIIPAISDDPFYPLDYGFSQNDFENAFEISLPFFHTPIGLKEYITTRRNAVISQIVINDIFPIISEIKNNNPNSIQDISIRANVADESIASVELCYRLNGQNISCTAMYDDGLHADEAAGDGIYGVVLNALNQQANLEYYIKATDSKGKVSQQPRCDFKQIFIGNSTIPLVINEFMASNQTTIADNAGEYDDWIELYNFGDVPVYLGDYFLSDKEDIPNKWPMPDAWIQPDEYLIFWADEDGNQGSFHTNFKLSADGEFIGLFDSVNNDYALIDGISFPPQTEDVAWGRLPNATGPFQEVAATPGAHNQPPVSIHENDDLQLGVQLFPNPFNEVIHISIQPEIHEPLSLEIWDEAGRQMYRAEIDGGKNEFSIYTRHFSNGVYFVKIINEKGGERTRKMIRMKE